MRVIAAPNCPWKKKKKPLRQLGFLSLLVASCVVAICPDSPFVNCWFICVQIVGPFWLVVVLLGPCKQPSKSHKKKREKERKSHTWLWPLKSLLEFSCWGCRACLLLFLNFCVVFLAKLEYQNILGWVLELLEQVSWKSWPTKDWFGTSWNQNRGFLDIWNNFSLVLANLGYWTEFKEIFGTGIASWRNLIEPKKKKRNEKKERKQRYWL